MCDEQKELNDIDCGGLIPIPTHQIPIKKRDPTAVDQCNSSIHPIERRPIKNWKTGMNNWKCNHSGSRNGKKRYSCNNIVDDEKGLRLGLGNCLKCRTYQVNERMRNWDTRMVCGARRADRERLKRGKFTDIDWGRFITKDHMREVYKVCRKRCWWCGIRVREFDRNHSEGLTVDRLTNRPHYQKECAIACLACNRMSWRKKFDNIPWWAREQPGISPELVFQDWWDRYHQFQNVLTNILLNPELHKPNYTGKRSPSFV